MASDTAADITGFVTREQARLRRPRSVSRKIAPAGGGVALHYGGPAQELRNHSDCVRRWKGWQDYHMDTHGWSDLAYTGGVCDHGYAFAGRGAGVRTAANGTDYGNKHFYAVCWLGGDGEQPTAEALGAFRWWIVQLRKAGAGRAVRPHRFFKSTGCPGNDLFAAAAEMDDCDFTTPDSSQGDRMIVRFDGSNEVWEVVGSHLEYLTGTAFEARGLSHSKVVVLDRDHRLSELPRLKEVAAATR